MSSTSINALSSTSPIAAFEPNLSLAQLSPDEFNNTINQIISDGLKNHYSKEYMADQIVELANQNPDTAKELKIEPDYQTVLHKLVEPQIEVKNCAGEGTSSLAISRREQILNQQICPFEIKANPNADGSKPIFELHSQSAIPKYNKLIEDECKKQGLDPDLAKAIMYMETTHGYYDGILDPNNNFNKSIRPMNINVLYWEKLGYSRSDIKQPEINIKIGIFLIKEISYRVQDKSVAKIATLYNALNASIVSDYGARVEQIYRGKLWLNK